MINYSTKPKKINYSSAKPNIEKDSLDEVNVMRSETARFKENTDANYFAVVVFNNAAQLDEFYKKVGIAPEDKQYINGKRLARKLGIEITTPDKQAPGEFRVNKDLKEMAL